MFSNVLTILLISVLSATPLKLLVISDLHGHFNLSGISNTAKYDYVICLGDVYNFKNDNSVEASVNIDKEVFKYIALRFGVPKKQILFVPGNHDPPSFYTNQEFNSATNLHKKKEIMQNGFIIGGLGGSISSNYIKTGQLAWSGYPNSEESVENDINVFEKLDLLVLHQGPSLFATTIMNESPNQDPLLTVDSGSKSIRKFIENNQPKLVLHGHSHLGFGIGKIGNSVIVNPGAFKDKRYCVVKIDDDRKDPISVQFHN